MNILDRLLGKVSYIDDFKWPLRGPSVWSFHDINSLYPTIMNLPMLGITKAEDSVTVSYIEENLRD